MPHARLLAPTLVLLALAAPASRADAHAALVKADPAPNSAAAAPAMIELHFSEALTPKFSTFRITKNGTAVDVGEVSLEKDGLTLMAMPSAALAAGSYNVEWHVVSDDAHRSKGDYTFTIR